MAVKKVTHPLAGMENAPIEKKVCALLSLWVIHSKELALAYHLIELTALVAQQYVDDFMSEPDDPKPTKKKPRPKVA